MFQIPLWHAESARFESLAESQRFAFQKASLEVFFDWYMERLKGQPHAFAGFDDAADTQFAEAIIGFDDDWWQRSPAEVSADIQSFVDGLRMSKAHADEADVREILCKTASPEIFVLDGQFHARANQQFEMSAAPVEKPLTLHLIDLARLLAAGLEANAPPALSASLSTYADVLARDAASPVLQTLEIAMGVVKNYILAMGMRVGQKVWM